MFVTTNAIATDYSQLYAIIINGNFQGNRPGYLHVVNKGSKISKKGYIVQLSGYLLYFVWEDQRQKHCCIAIK